MRALVKKLEASRKSCGGDPMAKRTIRFKNEFDRNLLPSPTQYFYERGLKLIGHGEWRSGLCPFHSDTNPSLSVHVHSGWFVCRACGAKGRDVLDFHQKLHRLDFKNAAKELGAWR